jgi:hypothetical protein
MSKYQNRFELGNSLKLCRRRTERWLTVATLYDQQGRYAADERLCGRSLAIADKTLVPNHAEGALSLNNLADFSVVGEGGPQ